MLIDVPKDVQQQLAVPDWDVPMAIAGYMNRLPPTPTEGDIAPILQALKEARPQQCHPRPAPSQSAPRKWEL